MSTNKNTKNIITPLSLKRSWYIIQQREKSLK